MDIAEKAKKELYQAREPFDNALEAIAQIEKNREYILSNLIEVFKYLHPEFTQLATIRQMLREGTFPSIWYVKDIGIAIDGQLNKVDSLIDFLKNNSKGD